MDNSDYKMDSFIEKIVTRKKTLMDRLQITGIVLVAIFVLLFSGFFVAIPDIIRQYSIFIMAAVIYAIFIFMRTKNVEYEYAVTNGDMDIDKIIAQKKRKRIFSGHCRNFEIVAKTHSQHYNQSYSVIPNKILAVSSLDEDDVFFLVTQFKGNRTIVYFQPSEKMLKAFKTFIPSKVML